MRRWKHTGLLALWLLGPALPAFADEPAPVPFPKALAMHALFYLPFQVQFSMGADPQEVLPFVRTSAGKSRLMSLVEWEALNREWLRVRAPWTKQSLLLRTEVPTGGTVHISPHLVSHRIGVSEKAITHLALADALSVETRLRGEPERAREEVVQLAWLRSFLGPYEGERFNFFLVSASWCESCETYRIVLEHYFRTLPVKGVVFHSLVIDDPRLEVFSSGLMRELFPDVARFPADSVPRFIAIQERGGQPQIWQEGDAIEALLKRYLDRYRGFLEPVR